MLFIVSTLEGWPDIMYYFIDGSDEGTVILYFSINLLKGPIKEGSLEIR